MIEGIVIYSREDLSKNLSYIDWLIEDGRKKGLNIRLF